MTTIRLRSRRKNFLTASRISSYFKHKLGLLWKVFIWYLTKAKLSLPEHFFGNQAEARAHND
jgi:hypothetical protein